MKIELKLYASLARYAPSCARKDAPGTIAADEGEAVGDVLARCGVPREEIKIIFLNGIHAKEEDPLKEGDRLAVFPPIAGG